MTILCVVAHPDDETVGMGAAIARFAAEGHRVCVGAFTDGVGARGMSAEAVNRRIAAQMDAARVLGFDWMSGRIFPDQQLDTVSLLDLTKQVEGWIAEARPTIVFTHSPHDENADHVQVYRACLPAVRPKSGVREVYSFAGPRVTRFQPTVFWEVSAADTVAQHEAMRCYGDELAGEHTLVSGRTLAWGYQIGVTSAEGFEPVRIAR